MTAASDHETPDPVKVSRRVFISHSSKDREAANRLCELLEERGIGCWIAPRDVVPGENYGSQIVHGLQDSDDLVILLSADSLESRHVSSEVARAFEKGKNIYPLRLAENVWPTEELELFVTSSHWVEVWDKEMPEAASELVEAIQNKAAGKARPQTVPRGPAARRRSFLPMALFILLCALLAVLIPFWLVLRDPERGDALVKRLPTGLQGTVNKMRGHTPVAEPLARRPATAAAPVASTEPAPAAEIVEPPFGKRLWQSLNPAMDFIWIDSLGLWVGKFEVTNEQYRRFKEDHWSGRFQGERLDGNPQPVVKVSHRDAVEFTIWLTENDDQNGNIPESGWHYRLPREKEWMAIATCGDDRRYPWGNGWPPDKGNYADRTLSDRRWATKYIEGYNDTFRVTCAVYESGKNEWDLYGVGGNAWEWMLELVGGQGVVRGGAWDRSVPEHLSCSMRAQFEPSEQHPAIGFRVVFASPGSGHRHPRPGMQPGMRRGPSPGGRGSPDGKGLRRGDETRRPRHLRHREKNGDTNQGAEL